MRVAIDVTTALQADPTGIGWYVRVLLEALASNGTADDYLLCRKLGRRRDASALPRLVGGLRAYLPFEAAGWWNRALLGPVDVFHHPKNKVEGRLPGRQVVTLHDTFDLHFRLDTLGEAWRRRVQAKYARLRERAHLVMVPSRYTRDEAVREGLLDAARLRVVPNAVRPAFGGTPPVGVREAVLARHRVEGPYLLYAGALSLRKNVPRLLDAFRAVAASIPHTLVLAGRTDTDAREEVERRLADPTLGTRVRRTGYLPEGDLPALMASAEAFVFPSLCEGFGLPPLEAMACGTPVLAATGSALPEVLGDAALLVDPEDERALAEGLLRIATDGPLREDLGARGRIRSAGFTPEAQARAVRAVYEEAAT
ncbi:MAG: glycosyltransferase family 4 protein [Planctomycetes bacterium]|nr:glycosyltransferase family 4 protein [Planctomycetota bacterium]